MSATSPDKTNLYSRLSKLVIPYKSTFILGVILTLSLALLGPVRPYLFQYVLDHAVPAKNVSELRFWMLIALASVFVQVVLMYYQTRVTNFIGQSVINDLRKQVFAHILTLRIQYFDRIPVGTLLTRTVSDIQTLSSVFSEGIVTISGELLQLGFILGLMFYTNWRLTLVCLIVMPLLLLATWVFKIYVKSAFEAVRKYVAEMSAFLQEHITGVLVTQLHNRESHEFKAFKAVNQKHRNAHLDSVFYYSVFFPVIDLISSLATALLVWYGANGVLTGEISFGVLVAFLMYIQMFFRPIRMLADQFNTLQMGVVSAERIFKVLDTQEFISNQPNAIAAPQAGDKQTVHVTFDKVNFYYNPDQPILKNISFEVSPGTTTALVGATGSGKSTIINTLLRLYEIQSGQILINQIPLQSYEVNSLHQITSLVLQDVFLFSGTIFDNITLYRKDITLEAVQQASEEVGAHKFIERLPGGYFYRVGERGGSLSAGQRQLIAFIRSLVFNPNLLLLDEATANIDSETELLIQKAIAKILYKRTAIIVAHRLSTIQQAHQILVIHKGEIVERGNHQELLAQKGRYYKLYRLQYEVTERMKTPPPFITT